MSIYVNVCQYMSIYVNICEYLRAPKQGTIMNNRQKQGILQLLVTVESLGRPRVSHTISMKPYVCLMNPISFDAVNPIESPLSHIRMYINVYYIYIQTWKHCFFWTYFCLQEPI